MYVNCISGVLRVAESVLKKYGTVDTIFQTVMCIWDVLNMGVRVQINGFILLHDGSMSDTDTVKSYNVLTMRRCMNIYQVSMEFPFWQTSCQKRFKPKCIELL